MTPTESFADPAIQRCPFPLIQRLHKESLIYRDPLTGFYVITRYADIAAINARPDLYSNRTSILMSKAHSPNAVQIARSFHIIQMRHNITLEAGLDSRQHFRAAWVDHVPDPSISTVW